MNATARRTFIPGYKLSLDEGGHATRSRFCPCRQYNKDKPNKFRIDFYILCDAHEYFICHIDVYQGKNGANIGIHPDVQHLPSTAKAVANAVICSLVSNDPMGYREIFTDNRYSSIELAVFLRSRCQVLTAGTIRKNRKGMNKDIMNMSKKNSNRGDSKVYYDDVNKVAVVQWHDNKVVSVVSTLGVRGKVELQRRSGAKLIDLETEQCVREYQLGMGGVDRGDQIRETGAGFCRKAHFKKWYKKSFFAVCDFMLLNSFLAWNLAAKEYKSGKRNIKKCDYYAALAEELIQFSDTGANFAENLEVMTPYMSENILTPAVPTQVNCCAIAGSHTISDFKNSNIVKPFCSVCRTEEHIGKKSCGSYSKNTLAYCADCGLFAHTGVLRADSEWHSVSDLSGKTCFEMLHSKTCAGLWMGKNISGRRNSVMTGHLVYKELQKRYSDNAK